MQKTQLSILLFAALAAHNASAENDTANRRDPAPIIRPAMAKPSVAKVAATAPPVVRKQSPATPAGVGRVAEGASPPNQPPLDKGEQGTASAGAIDPDARQSPSPVSRHKKPKDPIQHDFFRDAPHASDMAPLFIHAFNKPLDKVLAEIYPEYRIEIRGAGIKDREVSITGNARRDILYAELMAQMPDIKGWHYKEKCLLIVDYNTMADKK